MKLNKSLRAGIYTVSIITFLTGCENRAPKTAPPKEPVGVVGVVAEKIEISNNIRIVGQVAKLKEAELRARIEGVILEANFKTGESVKKGDVIYRIEKDIYQADAERIAAELEKEKAVAKLAEVDYLRAKRLFSEKAISAQEYDQAASNLETARASVKVQEASLNRALLDLKYTEIPSPINGVPGIGKYDVGNLVNPQSQPLLKIIQTDPILIEFYVPEAKYTEYARRKADKHLQERQVNVYALLPDGKVYDKIGKIYDIDNEVNRATGSILLRAIFDNPDRILTVGQYVRVILVEEEKTPSLMIPQAAVQEDQQGAFVMVVGADKTPEVRRITTGRQYDMNIVVESGLNDGETIITQGLQKVRPGEKIALTLDDGFTSSLKSYTIISKDELPESMKTDEQKAEEAKEKEKLEKPDKPKESKVKEKTPSSNPSKNK
ncbi:MAG: efflux RND transporter periplasmic adaptor subunit [Lentisphaeria bacterium]|nr:efflux RND transporter periplasmic adaptor subunit [Lentisphaeria bacterium]